MPSPQVITDIYQGRVKVFFSPGRHTYMVTVPGVVTKQWFPSVTGVLGVQNKPQLINWAAKQAIAYVGKQLGKFESSQGAPPFTIDTAQIHAWLEAAEDGWREEEATTIGSLAHRFMEAEILHRAGQGPKPKFPMEIDPVLSPDITPAIMEQANASIRAGVQFLDEHSLKPRLLERVLFSPTEAYIGTCDFAGELDGELCILDHKTSRSIYSSYRLQLAAYANAFFQEFGEMPKARWVLNIQKQGGLAFERYGLDTYQEDLDAFRNCLGLYAWERANDPWKKGAPIQPLGDLDRLIPRPNIT